MVSIYDYSISDLENYFANMGLKPYKAKQLFKWLYEKRVHDFDEMSDISKKVIAELKNDFSIDLLNIRTSQTSKDGTIKFLFELSDGALIESVLMKFDYGYSACISYQVGCTMGCSLSLTTPEHRGFWEASDQAMPWLIQYSMKASAMSAFSA